MTVCEATKNAVPLVASCPSWGLMAAYNLAFDPNYADGGAPPSTTRLREACSITERQCQDAYASPAASECDLGFRDTCTGSVAQLEACINDTLAATRTLLDATPPCAELSCATFPRVAQQWLDDSNAFTASLASCSAFYDTCADIGGTGDTAADDAAADDNVAEHLEPSATPMVADVMLECAD
jgi:hypothetical protein